MNLLCFILGHKWVMETGTIKINIYCLRCKKKMDQVQYIHEVATRKDEE